MKEFFKPTLGKTILTIIFFILGVAIFEIPFITCLLIYPSRCSFDLFPLLLDLIIGYLISCSIIYIYNKIKK